MIVDPDDDKEKSARAVLPESYAGISGNVYGGSAEEQLEYVRGERESWAEPS